MKYIFLVLFFVSCGYSGDVSDIPLEPLQDSIIIDSLIIRDSI